MAKKKQTKKPKQTKRGGPILTGIVGTAEPGIVGTAEQIKQFNTDYDKLEGVDTLEGILDAIDDIARHWQVRSEPLKFEAGLMLGILWRKISDANKTTSIIIPGNLPRNWEEAENWAVTVRKLLCPKNIVTAKVATTLYKVKMATIKRRIDDGTLTDYRPKGGPKNAPLEVDCAELFRLYPRRKA